MKQFIDRSAGAYFFAHPVYKNKRSNVDLL